MVDAATLDLQEHRLQYRMKGLLEQRKLDERRVRAVAIGILAAGLSVILLNLLITFSIGFETILADYRLMFLVPFSLLTGLLVVAYGYYYRASAMATVHQRFLTRMDSYEYEMDRLENARRSLEAPPPIMPRGTITDEPARPLPGRYV